MKKQKVFKRTGLSKAAKKSSNVAAEGIVTILVNGDNTKATMTEVNSQTDFVAKNEQFLINKCYYCSCTRK